MHSIKLARRSEKQLLYFYLIPDLKTLAKEFKSASCNCNTKELLGESKEKLREVKTTITISTAISNVHHLLAYPEKIVPTSRINSSAKSC